MKIRKFLAFAMAVVMAFSVLPMQLFAVETDAAENTLLMKYDDRLEVSELGMTGAPVIVNKEIKSKKVCSDEADDAVVVYVDGKLIAVGVGTAQVTWGTGTDAVSYEITVEPATISVFLVTGHSKAAGSGGDKAESVVCEEGQVYSTHEGTYNFLLCEGDKKTTVSAKDVTGMGIGYGSENKPPKIDALTEAGDGARALDGALAYQWHKLSGEKVWVLNAAKGSTSLQTWQRGGYNYRHAVELFKAASAILNNEHQAGHYNVNRMGVVNYTAANGDQIWPEADYKTAFNSMWHGFREEFALYDLNGDGETDTVDCIGLAPSWGYLRTYNVWDDLIPEPLAFYNYSDETNTGKVINYYMSAFENDGVILASTVGRRWTTDADVKAYFEENPVENMYGVLQNGKTHTSPTEVQFGVNADGGHYTQLGYNVQGIEIANSMYAYWNGNNALQSVRLLQENGVDEVPESIEVPLNRSYVIVPETVPSTAKLTYEVTGDAAYYENGFIYGNHEGDAVLKVMDTARNVLKTVNVTITEKVAKEDYKWYVWDFATPSLTNTQGSMTNNELSLHASAVSDTNLQSCLKNGVLDLTANQSTLKMSKSILLETPKAWSVELVAQAKSSDAAIGTFLSTNPSMSEAKYMCINNQGDLMLAIKAVFTADDGTALSNNYTYFKVSDEDFAKSKLGSNFDVSQEHKYELRCAGGIISYWLDGEKVGDLVLSEQSLYRGDDAKHYTSKQPDYNGENFNSMTMVYWGTGSSSKNYSQAMTAKVKKLAIYAGAEMLNLKVVLSAIPAIPSIAIRPGDSITLPAPDTSDYCAKFVCWSETPSGDGTTYNAGDVYTVNSEGSVTLYAIWDDSAGLGADHEYDNPCEDTDCNACGTTRVPPHAYENGCDADCNECGEVRTVPAHVYENGCDADCNECGEVRAVPAHVYDNVCDATCNVCWEVREIQGHVYDNACDTTCNVCGVERPVSGHVYDNDSDVSCNVCGTERTLQGTTGACTWKLKGDVLTISGNGAMAKYTTTTNELSLLPVRVLIIENGVTAIGEYSFEDCTTLTTVVLPKSVTNVKQRAFDGCLGIANVWYEGSESDKGNITFGGYNKRLSGSTWHYGACVNNMDGNWEHSYDNIVDDTCNLCSGTRTLPYDDYGATGECFWYLEGTKLTIFGDGAMENYTQKAPAPWGTSVTELVIEEGVTYVGSYAFSGCAGLTTVTLPDSVTNTAIYSFYNCTNLKTVVISDSIVKISRYSFYNCIGITNVWYEGSESDRNAIEISSYNARLTDATWHYDCCMENPGTWTHVYEDASDVLCDECGYAKLQVASKINLAVEERIYLNLWLDAEDVDAYKALTGKDFTYNATMGERSLGEGTVTGAPVETEYGTYYIVRLDAVSANLFGEQISIDCPTGAINAVGDEDLTVLNLAKEGTEAYEEQEVKDLFTALYNYGASATGEALLPMPETFVEDQEDDIQVTAKTNETVDFKNVYLLMGDSIGIRLKGKLLGDENALSVKVNGNENNACKLNVGADGTLTIDLYVSADYFNSNLTIEVYGEGEVIASFVGTVKGYSEQIADQDAKTLALAQFVQACVNYKAA